MGNVVDTQTIVRQRPKETQLLHAAQTGNLDLLKRLLSNDCKDTNESQSQVDIDSVNSSALTALVLAAKEGHADCVKMLLDAGAKVDGVGEGNYALTPIWMATYAGHDDCVKLLIQAGANLNTKYPETPLYIAAREGRSGCLRLLIDAGSDLEVKNNQGQTPLCVACRENHKDSIKLLVLAGSDVNASDKLGHNPLFFACQSTQLADLETLELLLDSGSDVNQVYKTPNGFTPLHVCAFRGDPWTCRLLLLYGSNPFAKDNQGRTPIEVAKEHPLLKAWLALYEDYIPSLKQLCCWKVRKYLGYKTFRVKELPLPTSLHDYLTDHKLWVLPTKECRDSSDVLLDFND